MIRNSAAAHSSAVSTSQLEYTGDYGLYNVPQSTWQKADNISWVKGKHNLKFGGNIMRRQVDFFRPLTGKGFFNLCGNGQSPSITGYEVTDLLIGFTCNYQVGPVLGDSETRNWENGFYGQDDWRITAASHSKSRAALGYAHLAGGEV